MKFYLDKNTDTVITEEELLEVINKEKKSFEDWVAEKYSIYGLLAKISTNNGNILELLKNEYNKPPTINETELVFYDIYPYSINFSKKTVKELKDK